MKSYIVLFIRGKSQAIYRMMDHPSLGNVHRMIGMNPFTHNTYEEMTYREEGKRPNIYDRQKWKSPDVQKREEERKTKRKIPSEERKEKHHES